MPVFLCEPEAHKFRECEGWACAAQPAALRKNGRAQDQNSAERNFVMRRRASLETTERLADIIFSATQNDHIALCYLSQRPKTTK